jgi:tRNA nucleotidyltransferase (CCA-adding enzyme)
MLSVGYLIMKDKNTVINIQELMSRTAPSTYIEYLRRTNTLPIEIKRLIDVPQDALHHPEGSTYVHTLMVMDAAYIIARRDNFSDNDRMILILAAMCHDLGKVTTTVIHPDGKVTAHGHPECGIMPTTTLLRGIGVDYEVIAQVLPLVREHMVHVGFFTPDITTRSVRRIVERIKPSNMFMLSAIIEADASGRGGKYFMQGLPERMQQIMNVYAQDVDKYVQVFYPDHILSGDVIMSVLGIAPSKELGKIKDECYKAQLDGKFNSLDYGVLYLLMNYGMKG